MREIVARAGQLLSENCGFALAVILTQSGSTPREAGTIMLIEPDGSITGTIGGGLPEGATITSAKAAIGARESRLLHFDMTNEDTAGDGLICGGIIDVFVDVVKPDAAYPKRLFAELGGLFERGGRAWWGFYPQGAPGGADAGCRQCLLKDDGTMIGPAGNWPDAAELGGVQPSRFDVFTLSEDRQLYLKRVGSEGRAVVYGGGHVARQLVPLLGTLGFETTVIDDRAEFANSAGFPSADNIIVHDLSEGVVEAVPLASDSYAIIVTRGHSFDLEVLRQVLVTDAAYIGMIGSRKKRDAIYENLLENGFTQADIDRVHSPIGLAIKAQTPEEIAVSIAAEMILVRRDGGV